MTGSQSGGGLFRGGQALAVGAVFIALSISVTIVSLVGAPEHLAHGVAASILILVCGVSVIYDLTVFRSNLFAPLLTVSLYHVVFFALGPWISALTSNNPPVSAITPAALTVHITAGAVVMLLGYIWGGALSTRGSVNDEPAEWPFRPVIWIVAMFLASGVAGAFLYLENVGGLLALVDNFGGRISQFNKGQGFYILLLESSQTAVIVWIAYVLSITGDKATGINKAITVFLIVIVSLLRLTMGSRTGLLWPLLGSLIIYNNYRRRIRLIELLIIVVCGGGAVYALGEVRTLLGRNQGVESIRELQIDRHGFAEQVRAEYGGMLDVTTSIIDSVPASVPYQLGKTYALGFAYVVPRQIWIDKPPSAAELLSDVIHAGSWNGSSYITPGLWGEAYMNFGYLGWIIVPLALGVVLRRLGTTTLKGTVTPAGAVMYVYVFQFANGIALGDFVNIMVRLLPQACLAWAACRLLDRCAPARTTVRPFHGLSLHGGTGLRR